VAGLVGMGGSALGLPAALTGGVSGFSVGAIQQTASNLMEGQPWYAGVSESALIGAVSGAAAGGIVGAANPQNLAAKVLVGGLAGGGVGAGAKIAFNAANGDPLFDGVGTAFGMGFANGAIDAFTDYYGDKLVDRAMTPRSAAGDADGWRGPRAVDDADVRRALRIFDDPNASRQYLFWAQNELLDAGVRGSWRGGESLEQMRARQVPEGDEGPEASRSSPLDAEAPTPRPTGAEDMGPRRPGGVGDRGEVGGELRRPDEVIGTVVEFGSGEELANAPILREMYPEADILLTESADVEVLAQRLGGVKKANDVGAQVRFGDYNELASEGVRADVSIAIAPYPGYFEGMVPAIKTAHTMADITNPGGRIYVAAAESTTAEVMAQVFRTRYGIDVTPKPAPRGQVPFWSKYLHPEVYVIDFRVPR
jgi:hypothetical protein